MKDCVHLLVIYTLLELSFTALYCLLAKSPGTTVFIGALLYAACVGSVYLSYRKEQSKKENQDLLNGFLHPSHTSP